MSDLAFTRVSDLGGLLDLATKVVGEKAVDRMLRDQEASPRLLDRPDLVDRPDQAIEIARQLAGQYPGVARNRLVLAVLLQLAAASRVSAVSPLDRDRPPGHV